MNFKLLLNRLLPTGNQSDLLCADDYFRIDFLQTVTSHFDACDHEFPLLITDTWKRGSWNTGKSDEAIYLWKRPYRDGKLRCIPCWVCKKANG